MRTLVFLTALVALSAPLSALAANPDKGPGSGAATGDTPARQEARERYERGLKLFADRDFEAARIEFTKAYELAPSYKILYNIGVCDANRNDYVGAISNLERYLSEGGSEVPAERHTEVDSLLRDIRPRVGHLSIQANVDGAVVTIDDVGVGVTPLTKPIDVNPGTRKVTTTKRGYIPSTQAVTVAGSETQVVRLSMQPTQTVTIKRGASPWPFVLWGSTAALAIGAGITGYFALKTSDDLNTLDNSLPPPNTDAATYQKELESKRSDMRTFSIAADLLALGAVVVGATALVVTIVTVGKSKEAPAATIGLAFRPGGLGLSGSF